jgi:hypothetical protein
MASAPAPRLQPSLVLEIPALQGDHFLVANIYYPVSIVPGYGKQPWQRHAAVVAHPYGPMGGDQRDVIVMGIAEELLAAGFLVMTFNNRYSITLAPPIAGLLPPTQVYLSQGSSRRPRLRYLDRQGRVERPRNQYPLPLQLRYASSSP